MVEHPLNLCFWLLEQCAKYNGTKPPESHSAKGYEWPIGSELLWDEEVCQGKLKLWMSEEENKIKKKTPGAFHCAKASVGAV